MLLRSNPRPQIGWRTPIVAVLMGVFLPMFAGVAYLYLVDVPLVGLPKEAPTRTAAQHLGFVAAALATAPIIAWVILPVAIPGLRLLVQIGWAGGLCAVGLAVALGLPMVHWMLNGDVITEDTSVLPHIILALIIQGLTGWAALQVLLRGP